MKVFGYIQHQENENGPSPLSEVSFQASPHELREVASFILEAAAELEAKGHTFDHCHLQDKHPELFTDKECPDVIVVRLV